MKIEKINDNQIRCTLTKADLEDRQIRLSELKYGTEKARELFRDMMQQASNDFGFEADNIPLMIEAIPISADSIILIITKVENPEELDTRFSKFTATDGPAGETPLQQIPDFEGADGILDLIQKLYDAKTKAASKKEDKAPDAKKTPKAEEPAVNLIRQYHFTDLDQVIGAAHSLNHFFEGRNTLYNDKVSGEYELIVHQSGVTPALFNKVCNILSEYGSGRNGSQAGEAFLQEHFVCVIRDDALQKLSSL